MAVSVEVLHLGVVCPLVGHVERRLHRAAVGVVTSSKQIFIELLVEVVDGIIEGEEDELRYLVGRVAARDVPASTVTVLQYDRCYCLTIGILELRDCFLSSDKHQQ